MVRTDRTVVCSDHGVNSTGHGVIYRIMLDAQMNSSDIFQVFIYISHIGPRDVIARSGKPRPEYS